MFKMQSLFIFGYQSTRPVFIRIKCILYVGLHVHYIHAGTLEFSTFPVNVTLHCLTIFLTLPEFLNNNLGLPTVFVGGIQPWQLKFSPAVALRLCSSRFGFISSGKPCCLIVQSFNITYQFLYTAVPDMYGGQWEINTTYFYILKNLQGKRQLCCVVDKI